MTEGRPTVHVGAGIPFGPRTCGVAPSRRRLSTIVSGVRPALDRGLALGEHEMPGRPSTGSARRSCRILGVVRVHLVDGTYELFRHFHSPAARFDRGAPEELRAVRGVVGSILGMLEGGVTHLGVATDHVIESFRNALWPGYKTGEGVDPLLYAQFAPLEEALVALGVVVWPMVEFEADDALAAAAAVAARDARVDRVVICTPDKDLAQCVRGTRIVQLDRRTRTMRDESGVVRKFGIPPASIPDYLALVGDAADGYPGLPGWGAKSAAAVLARFGHLEEIPEDWHLWHVNASKPAALADTFLRQRDLAFLFRTLATLRTDVSVFQNVDELHWKGPTPQFPMLAAQLDRAAGDGRSLRISLP
jgi:5'-3' exonuclease